MKEVRAERADAVKKYTLIRERAQVHCKRNNHTDLYNSRAYSERIVGEKKDLETEIQGSSVQTGSLAQSLACEASLMTNPPSLVRVKR
jgi:hypothetical protein